MIFAKKRYTLTIASLIFGIIIALQFRSVLFQNKEKLSASHTLDSINVQLENEKKIGEKLKEEINIKSKKNDEYLKLFVASKNNDTLEKQWKSTMQKAGLTDVKGPGIIFTLNDAAIKNAENITLSIVHDIDLLLIINEMKKAGAQAISINNERIIATSEQLCIGPTIRINKKRILAPFEIKAIGNPDKLKDSLIKSEIYMILNTSNIRMDIIKSNDIIIPKFNGNVDQFISELEEVE